MDTTRDSVVLDIDGPVHLAAYGGPEGAPVALCVHGLAGSSLAWGPLAESLTATHRVLAIDLPGHGRSPRHGRSLSVDEAAGVVRAAIEALGTGPVTLVGHSMGAAVCVLAAASAPEVVDGVLLLAPPLPREGLTVMTRAVLPQVVVCLCPPLGVRALRRRMARQTIEEHVWERLRLTCASVSGLHDIARALAAELQTVYDEGEDPHSSFVRAARSVGLLVATGRTYRQALAAVAAPVRVLHGSRDRVIGPEGLHQLARLQPDWQVHVLADIGHSPHLEVPAVVAQAIEGLVDSPRPVDLESVPA